MRVSHGARAKPDSLWTHPFQLDWCVLGSARNKKEHEPSWTTHLGGAESYRRFPCLCRNNFQNVFGPERHAVDASVLAHHGSLPLFKREPKNKNVCLGGGRSWVSNRTSTIWLCLERKRHETCWNQHTPKTKKRTFWCPPKSLPMESTSCVMGLILNTLSARSGILQTHRDRVRVWVRDRVKVLGLGLGLGLGF
jgi:hypothetical protein